MHFLLWGDKFGCEPTIAKKCLMQNAPFNVAVNYMEQAVHNLLSSLQKEEKELMRRAVSLIERNKTSLDKDKEKSESDSAPQENGEPDKSDSGKDKSDPTSEKGKSESETQEKEDSKSDSEAESENTASGASKSGNTKNASSNNMKFAPLTDRQKSQLQSEIMFAEQTLARLRDVVNARTGAKASADTILTDLEISLELGLNPTRQNTATMLQYIKSLDFKMGSTKEEDILQTQYTPQINMSYSDRSIMSSNELLAGVRLQEGILVEDYLPAQARISIVLDTSGSMEHYERLEKAKALSASFYLSLTKEEREKVEFYEFNNYIRKLSKHSFFNALARGGTDLSGLEKVLTSSHRDTRWLVITDGDIPDLASLNLPKCLVISLCDTKAHHPNLVEWAEDPQSLAYLKLKMRQVLK